MLVKRPAATRRGAPSPREGAARAAQAPRGPQRAKLGHLVGRRFFPRAHRVDANAGLDLKNHNMKLLIALALAAAPSALAMAPYVPSELNGCGQTCAEVVTLDEIPGIFNAEDNKCYEVEGEQPASSVVLVKEGVKCAKITVRSGFRLVPKDGSVVCPEEP